MAGVPVTCRSVSSRQSAAIGQQVTELQVAVSWIAVEVVNHAVLGTGSHNFHYRMERWIWLRVPLCSLLSSAMMFAVEEECSVSILAERILPWSAS